MIKISYKTKDNNILELKVLGHAELEEDCELSVVCACVSSIVIGGLNAINDDTNYNMNVKSGDVEVYVNKINSNDNVVLTTIIRQLETLKNKYSKSISIKKE